MPIESRECQPLKRSEIKTCLETGASDESPEGGQDCFGEKSSRLFPILLYGKECCFETRTPSPSSLAFTSLFDPDICVHHDVVGGKTFEIVFRMFSK